MTALLAGCGLGGAGPAAPHTDQSEVCRPLADVTPQQSFDDCLRVARALDEALMVALTPMLPPGATISNSTDNQSGHELGGPGVQFYRFIDPSANGGEGFRVSLRIRDGGVPYNLDVELEKFDNAPPEAWCATNPASESKGIVNLECGKAEVPAGTVYRFVTVYPYGSGEYAKLRFPRAVVALHRTSGEVVRIHYDTVIEHDPRPITPGIVPMTLSMDQLVAIAKSPDLTVG